MSLWGIITLHNYLSFVALNNICIIAFFPPFSSDISYLNYSLIASIPRVFSIYFVSVKIFKTFFLDIFQINFSCLFLILRFIDFLFQFSLILHRKFMIFPPSFKTVTCASFVRKLSSILYHIGKHRYYITVLNFFLYI